MKSSHPQKPNPTTPAGPSPQVGDEQQNGTRHRAAQIRGVCYRIHREGLGTRARLSMAQVSQQPTPGGQRPDWEAGMTLYQQPGTLGEQCQF